MSAHGHGDYLCYVLDKCRCDECRAGNAAYARKVYRLKGYGLWEPFVDAQLVRDHLAILSAHGIGWMRAAQLAGVHSGTVSRLLYGRPGVPRSERVRTETGRKLLAVRPTLDLVADCALIDSTGTTRRIGALMALGFPQLYLAGRLGVIATNLSKTAKSARVRAATAKAIAALYDELRTADPGRLGISEQSQTYARTVAAKHGWPLPSVWGEDIDDPAAEPEPRRGAERWRAEDLVEEAEFLRLTLGLDRNLIAERLELTRDAIDMAYSRAAKYAQRELVDA